MKKPCRCDSTKGCTQNSAVWLLRTIRAGAHLLLGSLSPAHQDVLDPANV